MYVFFAYYVAPVKAKNNIDVTIKVIIAANTEKTIAFPLSNTEPARPLIVVLSLLSGENKRTQTPTTIEKPSIAKNIPIVIPKTSLFKINRIKIIQIK